MSSSSPAFLAQMEQGFQSYKTITFLVIFLSAITSTHCWTPSLRQLAMTSTFRWWLFLYFLYSLVKWTLSDTFKFLFKCSQPNFLWHFHYPLTTEICSVPFPAGCLSTTIWLNYNYRTTINFKCRPSASYFSVDILLCVKPFSCPLW